LGPNVIPDTATLTIDPRNPVDQRMSAAEEHLADVVGDLTACHGVQTTLDRMAKTAVVPFDEQVRKLIARTADDLGLDHAHAMSGAGHDAQESPRSAPPP
jgi:N-carbamoyl-L-amino-acid hydrolase